MAQTISPEAIEKGTGKSWDDWLAFFESIDAPNLSHKEIAELARSSGGAPSWWRQMVTVCYEQHIGRRVVGQDCNGRYAVSASKTVPGTMDQTLESWQILTGDAAEFSDVPVARGPEISKTETWRYWRCTLADGSKVNVNISQKTPEKCSLSIEHLKIESQEQADHWRAFWKAYVGGLGGGL